MTLDESVRAVVINRLALFFLDLCADKTTLIELVHMSSVESSWINGHDLFQTIRRKTLMLEKESKVDHPDITNLRVLECQYFFEEVCAKTLYNLSGGSAPFDQDCPSWILPNAITLAEQLGVDRHAVLNLANPT